MRLTRQRQPSDGPGCHRFAHHPLLMLYQRQIIAYHGCLRPRFEGALLNGITPPFSQERYDWLGKGIYFWERGPERALAWARSKAVRMGVDPAEARVLGAIIQLGNCLDLLDTHATEKLALSYESLADEARALGVDMPKNSAKNVGGDVLKRYLDRLVIDFAIDEMRTSIPIQTVRGAFWEGGAAFCGSAIQKKSHIQVAVRDTACIIGYFRPRIISPRVSHDHE